MIQKSDNKMIDTLDKLIGFKPIKIFINSIYVIVFISLIYFIFVGVTMRLFESYFEYVAFIFMFVFCFKELGKSLWDLPRFFWMPSIGILIYFVLIVVGYETAALRISLILFGFLLILSITYRIWLIKYCMEKSPGLSGPGKKYY